MKQIDSTEFMKSGKCYARGYGKYPECSRCKIKRHCKDAADPPLMATSALPEPLNEQVLSSRRAPSTNRLQRAERDRRYSRADLLEVITFMAALDVRSLDLVMLKLELPDLNLSDLAEKRGVSRQAVHRLVNQRLERIPELASVLTYRRHRNRTPVQNHTTTFMEEVCRIRKQTRENRSKKPKFASNCLRNLRSLKPSLLSSPMSILKGAAIWKNG